MLSFRLIPKRALLIAVCIVALAALFILNPVEQPLMPKCPFKLLTGLSCPGCGFQRAAHAFLHGRWGEAWAYNPFLLYALPWLFAVALTEWGMTGERKLRWQRIVEGKVAVWTYLLLFIAWGVMRNVWGI